MEKIVKKGFVVKGTTCQSCEQLVKNQALKVEGVKEIEFNLSTETGYVSYDSKLTDIDAILYKIEEKGYSCYILDESTQATQKNRSSVGIIIGILGLLLVGYFVLGFMDSISLPQISQGMGLGLLFIVGLLTGFHCIAMCGGFVVGYTAKNANENKKSYTSHVHYAVGKTLSYTLIGAFFGLIGSIIAFTPKMRAFAGIVAGLFLIIYGLKMLNIFPALRGFSIKMPKFISGFAVKNSSNKRPFVIGLLNGLMIACGPLQAIYIMAAGTGSAMEGAKLLLVFGLGTLPALMGFGIFSTFISSKITTKILKFSGAIVILLGIIMLNNGLTLSGSGFDFTSMVDFVSASPPNTDLSSNKLTADGYQEIHMEVDRYGWNPDKFVLKAGVPVRWIIDGKEINGCNNAIQVPEYGLEFDIKEGKQVIEFTPKKEGTVRWSCWMGMIPGTFIVKNDINLDNAQAVKKELDSVPDQPKGTCGGACGSPSCGAKTGGGCGCRG